VLSTRPAPEHRQRVYQLTSSRDFPKPVAGLAQGKIWLTDEVEAWIIRHRGGSGASA
jgi:predicted DNA-binding transcriptional regulator AlpA